MVCVEKKSLRSSIGWAWSWRDWGYKFESYLEQISTRKNIFFSLHPFSLSFFLGSFFSILSLKNIPKVFQKYIKLRREKKIFFFLPWAAYFFMKSWIPIFKKSVNNNKIKIKLTIWDVHIIVYRPVSIYYFEYMIMLCIL